MLLLLDIDGTLLLRASREHALSVLAGLEEVHGIGRPEGFVTTAGRTDPAIARSLAELAGLEAERFDLALDAWRAATVAHFARTCPADLSATQAPGARAALERLRAEGHRLSLVTGNLEDVAHLKLDRAGLGDLFDRGQGGFGSDAEDRDLLPGLARARAGTVAGPWPPQDTVVIGDTPRDVACARADGVRVVGVTTGPHPRADLAEADAVVDALGELPAVLASWA